ncbi:hypothetical protein GCM10011519_33890 [Marmoricola endophyticus]|uniref:DUF3558 domain-containing protein n=1 Tax=Marmoricola endophyticus TaxID=2040280 RepID=A0A917F8V5_9ACTN|nr:hypothetical protein GCM10011519_33890 [Marmoricola endophyticus]
MLLSAVAALTACSGEAPPTSQATAPPTPIARLNTDAMRLVRIEFCSLLPSSAVKTALDGRRGSGERWRSGQEVAVSGDAGSGEADAAGKDVVHENGCRWSADGYSAAAWLFADPVTTAQAREVMRAAGRQKGCTVAPGPDFGNPSQLQSCRLEDGSLRERYAGLFDDTWLTCEVQGPSGSTKSAVRSRAAAWCVQVANATNTTR